MAKNFWILLFTFCFCNFSISQSIFSDKGRIESLSENLDDADGDIRASAAIELVNLGKQGEAILLRRAASAPTLSGRIEAITVLRSKYSGLVNPELDKYMEELRPLLEKVFNPDPDSMKGSILQDPAFKNKGFTQDWSFHTEGQATGQILYDSVSRRPGSGCIKLIKTNCEGEIYLRSLRPVKVAKGDTCLVRIYFMAKNAPLTSAFQVLFEDKDGNVSMGNDNFAPDGQTFLHNTPEGAWVKRAAFVCPLEEDKEFFIRVALRGNPSEIWVDDISAPAGNTGVNLALMKSVHDPSVLVKDKTGFEKPAPIAEVKVMGDRARMVLDGVPADPVIYHVLESEYGDFTGMEKMAGIKIQTVYVNLVVESKSKSNPAPDFSEALKSLEYVALSAPESHYIITVHVSWSQDWLSENPEDVYLNIQGQKGYGSGLFEGFADVLPPGMLWWISPFSDKALKEAQQKIALMVKALKSSPYANRIIGCHIVGGHDGQFFTGTATDYSPAAQTAFRQWLKSNYKTDEALRKAWNNQSVQFDHVSIPDFSELGSNTNLPGDIFFNPQTDRRFMDQRQFQSERGMVIRDELAKSFKEAMGRPVIGITYAMWGGRGQGTETIFLNSKNLDILVPQPIYPRRLEGYLGGLRNAALGSYRVHNKMVIKELDLRTWLRNDTSETYRIWVGTATNLAGFESAFKKEVAQMMSIGQGFWMYDIHYNHFRDPQILKTINKGVKAYRELELTSYEHYKPDVAVVWVDASLYWEINKLHTNNGVLVDSHTGFHMMETGFTFDDLYLNDILNNVDLQQYKMYIFRDAWRLTEIQRKQIKEKLQTKGKILVWNYAPGYIGDDKLSVDYIGSLTGMNVKSADIDGWPKVRFVKSDHPLIKGLSGIVGMGEIDAMALAKGSMPGKDQLGNGFHRFFVDDKNSETLAEYEDGKTAVAVKHFPEWTSVYFGMLGSLDANILSRLAAQAGVGMLVTPGHGVEFNGHFLSVYGMKNERVTVTLPEASRVTDFDTHKEIATGREFSFDSKTGVCYWFRVEPLAEINK